VQGVCEQPDRTTDQGDGYLDEPGEAEAERGPGYSSIGGSPVLGFVDVADRRESAAPATTGKAALVTDRLARVAGRAQAQLIAVEYRSRCRRYGIAQDRPSAFMLWGRQSEEPTRLSERITVDVGAPISVLG
jgi:hypothetical protein